MTYTLTAAQRSDLIADLGITQGVQTVTISGSPAGGTFTLTYQGQTTSALAYNAAASVVQNALVTLSTVGAGNVMVSGNAGGPYTVTFGGDLARATASILIADGSALTGGTSPSVGVLLVTVFTDAELDRLFDRGVGDYDTAFVLALRQIRTQAARFYNYTVGQTTINRKQIFDNLSVVLAEAEMRAGMAGGGLFAGTISTDIDYPDFSSFDEFFSDPLLWSGM